MESLKEVPVTIIVSGRNSSTTLRSCLESLSSQEYPIDEILCFDNRSTDDSVEIAQSESEKSSVSYQPRKLYPVMVGSFNFT